MDTRIREGFGSKKISKDIKMVNKYIVREVAQNEWKNLWSLVEKSNLRQSWEYGDAKAASESIIPMRFVVESNNGMRCYCPSID